jgi:Zn-finger nucleic acid-binding protein
MNCPLCIDEVLDATFHGGIEVDVCPRCRGIWLDRGELERLAGGAAAASRPPAAAEATPVRVPSSSGAESKDSKKQKKAKKAKKKSLADRLGDVLEDVLDL